MAVTFHYKAVKFSLKNRSKLKLFLSQSFDNEGFIAGDIAYIFCNDSYLHPLNKNYLKHDTYTDILTFDLSEEEGKIIAEIYISVERVKENATAFKSTFEKELHRVIFHGLLHLCGYNDHTEEEKRIMHEKENEYLESYFNKKTA